MSRPMMIDSLTDDEQLSLLQLATVLAGDTEAGLQLLARSTLRTTERTDQIDALDYPEETARRQLIGTYLVRRGRPHADKVRETAAALRYFCGHSVAETARVLDLPNERVEEALRTADSETERFDTWEPLLEDPPNAAEIGPELQRRSRHLRGRRRRLGVMITAAAMIIGSAVVVPTVIIPRLPHKSHAVGVWSFVHTVEPPEGWKVTGRSLGTDWESTELSGPPLPSAPDERNSCNVTLHASGVGEEELGFDPEFVEGDDIRIDGRPGKLITRTRTSGIPPQLVWHYADDAWALVHCTDQTRGSDEILEQMANSVRYRSAEIKTPVRWDHLAAGLSVNIVGRSSLPEFTAIELTDDRPDAWNVSIVSPDPYGLSDDSDGSENETINVNGTPWHYSPASKSLCHTPNSPHNICLAANRRGQNDALASKEAAAVRQRLIDVATSAELAPDLANADTWFDAAEALP